MRIRCLNKKIFLGSGFYSHAAIWLQFLLFFGLDGFLNVFFNLFVVHSCPSFLFETSFHFSLMVSHAAFLHWFSLFFFSIWFFKKRFFQFTHSPFEVSFCLLNEKSLNCTPELVLLCFLQFKEFELYWGAVFFLGSVHTFSWFLKSNWSGDFGHAKTGNGVKKRVVLRREFFSL